MSDEPTLSDIIREQTEHPHQPHVCPPLSPELLELGVRLRTATNELHQAEKKLYADICACGDMGSTEHIRDSSVRYGRKDVERLSMQIIETVLREADSLARPTGGK